MLNVAGLQALLDDPRFATPEARLTNGMELVVELRAALARRDSGSWLEAFHNAAVPAALVGNLDDLSNDPQLEVNAMTVPIDSSTIRSTSLDCRAHPCKSRPGTASTPTRS